MPQRSHSDRLLAADEQANDASPGISEDIGLSGVASEASTLNDLESPSTSSKSVRLGDELRVLLEKVSEDSPYSKVDLGKVLADLDVVDLSSSLPQLTNQLVSDLVTFALDEEINPESPLYDAQHVAYDLLFATADFQSLEQILKDVEFDIDSTRFFLHSFFPAATQNEAQRSGDGEVIAQGVSILSQALLEKSPELFFFLVSDARKLLPGEMFSSESGLKRLREVEAQAARIVEKLAPISEWETAEKLATIFETAIPYYQQGAGSDYMLERAENGCKGALHGILCSDSSYKKERLDRVTDIVEAELEQDEVDEDLATELFLFPEGNCLRILRNLFDRDLVWVERWLDKEAEFNQESIEMRERFVGEAEFETMPACAGWSAIRSSGVSIESVREFLRATPNFEDAGRPMEMLVNNFSPQEVEHLLKITQGKIRQLTTIAVLSTPGSVYRDILSEELILGLESLKPAADAVKDAFMTNQGGSIQKFLERVKRLGEVSGVLDQAHFDRLSANITAAFSNLIDYGDCSSIAEMELGWSDPDLLEIAIGRRDADMLLPSTESVSYALPDGTEFTIRVAEKSDPAAWTGGNQVGCCATFGSVNQMDTLRRGDAAHLLIEIDGHVAGFSRLWLGEDKKTIVLNSLELGGVAARSSEDVRERVQHFMRSYMEGELPMKWGAFESLQGITRAHLGVASGSIRLDDLIETEVVRPLGDSESTRGKWNRGHVDAEEGQLLFCQL